MKLFNRIQAARTLKNDPFGFIIDSIIKTVINLIIPFPLVGDAALQFKGPILGCIVSLVVLGIFLFVVIGTIILSPFLATEGFLQKIIDPFTSSTHASSDSTFIQTSIPMQIPLGGYGFEFGSITAGFMEPSYFLTFGKNHTGVDLVPNENYYSNNQSYQQYKKVVVYATHSGSVHFYIDSYGSETVEVTSGDDSLKTIYMHMKNVYVASGSTVKAGSAIGEMGNTGRSTAEHIHYEIRIKSGTIWLPVNPMIYIK
jgi:murein DD-endopeptidase MepM/ murein hydrolase activator NlpD